MEQGVNNNVLGMTDTALKTKDNPHGLYSYANQTTAADATANRLKTLPYYKGIIASTGGTPSQQALAITTSPWHSGKSGVVDPYYLKGFVKAGLLTSTAGATPSSNPPATLASSSTTSLTTDQWNAVIAQLGGMRIISDQTAVDKIIAAAKTQGLDLSKFDFTPYLGGSVSNLRDALAAQGKIPAANIIPNLDLTGVLYFLGVILVGIAFLGVGGLVVLKGKK
jgi:hypothetical protein